MKNITKFFIIVGLIIFIVGLYSMFIKAGLPYQDPTPEMLKRWMFYYNFGKVSVFIGFGTSLLGVVLKIICRVLKK